MSFEHSQLLNSPTAKNSNINSGVPLKINPNLVGAGGVKLAGNAGLSSGNNGPSNRT